MSLIIDIYSTITTWLSQPSIRKGRKNLQIYRFLLDLTGPRVITYLNTFETSERIWEVESQDILGVWRERDNTK